MGRVIISALYFFSSVVSFCRSSSAVFSRSSDSSILDTVHFCQFCQKISSCYSKIQPPRRQLGGRNAGVFRLLQSLRAFFQLHQLLLGVAIPLHVTHFPLPFASDAFCHSESNKVLR